MRYVRIKYYVWVDKCYTTGTITYIRCNLATFWDILLKFNTRYQCICIFSWSDNKFKFPRTSVLSQLRFLLWRHFIWKWLCSTISGFVEMRWRISFNFSSRNYIGYDATENDVQISTNNDLNHIPNVKIFS